MVSTWQARTDSLICPPEWKRWPRRERLFAATYSDVADGWRVRITRPPSEIVAVFTAEKIDDAVLLVLIDQQQRAETLNCPVQTLHGFAVGGPERFAVVARERGWTELAWCRSESPWMTASVP